MHAFDRHELSLKGENDRSSILLKTVDVNRAVNAFSINDDRGAMTWSERLQQRASSLHPGMSMSYHRKLIIEPLNQFIPIFARYDVIIGIGPLPANLTRLAGVAFDDFVEMPADFAISVWIKTEIMQRAIVGIGVGKIRLQRHACPTDTHAFREHHQATEWVGLKYGQLMPVDGPPLDTAI